MITGVAGFIGFSLALRLLHEGAEIFGVDNLDAYYDRSLKQARLARDFTYIDDVVEALVRIVTRAPDDAEPQAGPDAPYQIYNVGNGYATKLIDFIRLIEASLGVEAHLDFLPMQPSDVPATMADVGRLQRAINYRPTTTPDVGIRRFVDWYIDYYGRP